MTVNDPAKIISDFLNTVAEKEQLYLMPWVNDKTLFESIVSLAKTEDLIAKYARPTEGEWNRVVVKSQ